MVNVKHLSIFALAFYVSSALATPPTVAELDELRSQNDFKEEQVRGLEYDYKMNQLKAKSDEVKNGKESKKKVAPQPVTNRAAVMVAPAPVKQTVCFSSIHGELTDLQADIWVTGKKYPGIKKGRSIADKFTITDISHHGGLGKVTYVEFRGKKSSPKLAEPCPDTNSQSAYSRARSGFVPQDGYSYARPMQ